MKPVADLIEGFLIAFIIGVVVLLGAATLIHTFAGPVERGDLINPPPALLCSDKNGHCEASQ